MKKPSDPGALQCRECGKIFERKRGRQGYRRTAEGVICDNRPECRGRQLSAYYEEHGLKRWARETQEQLLAVMDVPPAGWDPHKKWESVHLPHERVFAAIKFFSVCWPVCLRFAVQTDADGEPVKEYGDWKRHTHRSLAKVLSIDPSRVTGSVRYLKSRDQVEDPTDGDDRLYPNLSPAQLDAKKREHCAVVADPELKDIAGLPVKAFRAVAALKPLLPADAYTRIKEIARDACIGLNKAICDARTEASRTVLDACAPHASLLSRPGRSSRTTPASSSSEAAAKPQQSIPSEHDDDGGSRLKELYAAGFGKGALAKLPSPRSVLHSAQRIARAVPQLDEEAARLLYDGILEVDATVRPEEAIELCNLKLLQLREKIRRGKVDNIPGLLITSVPKMAKGQTLVDARANARLSAARQDREDQQHREWAQRVLANPESGEAERQWAREVLGEQTKGGSA